MIQDNEQPAQTLQHLIPSPEAIACLAEPVARRWQLVPLARRYETNREVLLLACANPLDQTLTERLALQMPTGLQAALVAANEDEISLAIDKCYAFGDPESDLLPLCESSGSARKILQERSDAIIRLLDCLLLAGSRQQASDIHISPEDQTLQVRFRVDGVLRHFCTLSKAVHNGLLVRIKILASMDIAEVRRPQDGQLRQLIDGNDIDFRVSCFPTVKGQNIVLRLLDAQRNHDTLARLNLPSSQHQVLAEIASRPEGLLVVCGPTGSGKSNTLHALLNERDAGSLNIMTLEDPVEISLAGLRQSSIDAEHAMDFAQGVRGLLRQDPDVLLIGEVRDTSSCAMALRAVMSGHPVLTTVHAGSALAGLARLRELGALAGQLAENLVAIASQRLVRTCCRVCGGRSAEKCLACLGCGYRGRQLIMELLLVTQPIAALIAAGASPEVLLDCATQNGFRTLRQQGEQLVRQGITSDKEIERVLGRASRHGCKNVLTGGVQDAVVHS